MFIFLKTTRDEKTAIKRRAKELGFCSAADFLKQVALGFASFDIYEEVITERLLHELISSTNKTSQAIDEMLQQVEASNKRIELMESAAYENRYIR